MLPFTFPERLPSLMESQLGLDTEEEAGFEDMLRASAVLTVRQMRAVRKNLKCYRFHISTSLFRHTPTQRGPCGSP